jgi:hypothetical protein
MGADKIASSNDRLDAAKHEVNLAAAKPSTPDRRAQYAGDLAARFQTYVDWAIENWPGADAGAGTPCTADALDATAFRQSRDELEALFRRLDGALQNPGDDPTKPGAAQFIPVTPMPWP